MDKQDLRDGLCEDLAELISALPPADQATTTRARWARELVLDLIGYKLDKLQDLGLEWR
jgi:hypothetical protein